VLGPGLARAGTPYLAAAHGFEYWLSIAPGTHALMRRATSLASRVPVMCSEFIARRVRTAVPRHVPVSVLYPGADLEVFRPDLPTADLRERHGVGDRPLVVCVSRLVARKGQDVLILAMERIRRRVPGATLLIVGGGPYLSTLERLAAGAPAGSVVFSGQVSEEDLPRYYAAGDVFAMPCRTRRGGMDVEGLGIVYLEASAVGLPVIAGNSGGAPDAVRDGETGFVVDGGDEREVAARLVELLLDKALCARLGRAGRAWVEKEWPWEVVADRLTELLQGTD
jgi:phosphatidylinositol alpha-1,6-mannosyltransferase